MIPYSVLDLANINQNESARTAFLRSLALAQHTEALGYSRFWVAEHHNMINIASAATAVLMGYLAGGTKTIRIGAGGIMLPNHAPLMVAEQFGTLESLYPGRIDLGLGRAPGTDPQTAYALRRDPNRANHFPDEVMELQHYFTPTATQTIHAIPGKGLAIPIWILGSSLFGAQLAAALGRPYAFAAHFAPAQLEQALTIYRRDFKPSEAYPEPYAMVCMNAVVADSDEEAQYLFTSMQQSFTHLVRNSRALVPPPVADMNQIWSPAERHHVASMLQCSAVGSMATVADYLQAFITKTQADELMFAGSVFDHQARLHSFTLLSQVMAAL